MSTLQCAEWDNIAFVIFQASLISDIRLAKLITNTGIL